MHNFIPQFIAEKTKNNEFTGNFSACTMFIDISGFTNMTQKLMSSGKEGAEILSNIINDIFTPSIKFIYDHGGFVSTFAGDAFTAVFITEKAELPLKAAYEINKMFTKSGKVKTKSGNFDLGVKIGLSYGRVDYGIIDAKVQKVFYFRGEAINSCADAEHKADRMQIVADNTFIQNLSIDIKKQNIEDKWFNIIPGDIDTLPAILTNMVKDIYEGIKEDFIPDSVLNTKYRGEFREIVSVFIGFEERAKFNKSIIQVIKNCHNYGGYFNKIDFGDKGGIILVVFGAPIGREKIYERAADFVLSLKNIDNFKFRAGISTDTAFCGIVGSELRKEYTALGDVVNLSARLMMTAEKMVILSGPKLRQNLSSGYHFEQEGVTEFKGFIDKVNIYSLKSKNLTDQRINYMGNFVGREKETAILNEFISPVLDGNFGGVVYIDGLAGVGKSRFIENFKVTIGTDSFFNLPCDEILRKSFNPFEYFFRKYFDQSESNSMEINKTVFKNIYKDFLNQIKTDDVRNELHRTESTIGALIGLEWDKSIYSQLDPQGRYENTIFAVKNFFIAQSLLKPVVIILDDAHWIDNDSLELVNILMRNVDNYPFIILALCRLSDDGSEFDLFKHAEGNVPKRLKLITFDHATFKNIVADKLDTLSVPEKTSNYIWEKSAGNPFFLEQLILYLQENNLFDNNLNIKTTSGTIPNGISQIIIARIDRLSEKMKETVKTASVLGREFTLQVLQKMLNDDNSNEITELRYIFKHALIRDTIYEMQLKGSIKNLHSLAGNIIEDIFRDNIAEYYEELADHYDKAEVTEKAIEYLEKAGIQAMENYHNEKALNFFERLLNYFHNKKDSGKIIEYLQKSAKILKLTGKWNDAILKYEEALSIAKEIEDEIAIVDCMNELSLLMQNQGKVTEALEILEGSLKIAIKINYERGLAGAYILKGSILSTKGNNEEAIVYHNKSLKIYEKTEDEKGIAISLGAMGTVFIVQGDFEKAMEYYVKQLVICKELNDRRGISIAYANISAIYKSQNEYLKALDYVDRAIDINRRSGNKYYLCVSLHLKVDILFSTNRIEEAKEINNECLMTANEADMKDYIFEATIQLHKLEQNIPALLEMLNNSDLEEIQIADINYEIWKITKEEKYKIQSISSYKIALEKFTYFEYVRRIEEMENWG